MVQFSRRQRLDRTEAGAKSLIEYLLKLAQETDPAKSQASQEYKNQKAWMALMCVGQLTQKLAGWAINHQIGLAINGLAHMYPPASAEFTDKVEYKLHRARLDSHENEMAGQSFDLKNAPPDLARRIFINCLAPSPAGLDGGFNDELVDALRALEAGEIFELLEAKKTRRKVKHLESKYQLRALCFVAYRESRGLSSGLARNQVSAAYGVSPATIRDWEKPKRLRKYLGELFVEAEIDRAVLTGRGDGPALGSSALSDWYGAEALKEAGCEYKNLKRTNKAKKVKKAKKSKRAKE